MMNDSLIERLLLVAQAIKPIKAFSGMDATIHEAIAALSAPAGCVVSAAIRVCDYDWSDNDDDAVAAVQKLRESLEAMPGVMEPAKNQWRPISAAPENKLCVVGWKVAGENGPMTERHEFDYIACGRWVCHDALVENAMTASHPSRTPSLDPPYEWFIELTDMPSKSPKDPPREKLPDGFYNCTAVDSRTCGYTITSQPPAEDPAPLVAGRDGAPVMAWTDGTSCWLAPHANLRGTHALILADDHDRIVREIRLAGDRLAVALRDYQEWNPMNCEREADLHDQASSAIAGVSSGIVAAASPVAGSGEDYWMNQALASARMLQAERAGHARIVSEKDDQWRRTWQVECELRQSAERRAETMAGLLGEVNTVSWSIGGGEWGVSGGLMERIDAFLKSILPTPEGA